MKMREIKFKAFDKLNKDVCEVGFIDFPNKKVQLAIVRDGICYKEYLIDFKHVKMLQYTGLKDKNGKEIYEGDILQNDRGTILKVLFEEGAFCATGTDALNKSRVFSLLYDFYGWSSIIGNIYENPELLEESK